jgi:hypothetical protein
MFHQGSPDGVPFFLFWAKLVPELLLNERSLKPLFSYKGGFKGIFNKLTIDPPAPFYERGDKLRFVRPAQRERIPSAKGYKP